MYLHAITCIHENKVYLSPFLKTAILIIAAILTTAIIACSYSHHELHAMMPIIIIALHAIDNYTGMQLIITLSACMLLVLACIVPVLTTASGRK